MRSLIRPIFSIVFLLGLWSAASAADLRSSIEQCARSKVASVRIAACTIVISRSRNAIILERAFDRRGLANMESNKYADAARDFTAVIRLDPKIAGYFDNRQNAYKAMGRLGEALKDANTAVRLAPRYSFVYHSRGDIYAEMGKYKLAIKDYTRGISLAPGDLGLMIDRGKALVKAGHPRAAISDFTRALDTDPSQTEALRERGLAYMQAGDTDAAQKDLIISLRINPTDAEVVQALSAMQKSNDPNSADVLGNSARQVLQASQKAIRTEQQKTQAKADQEHQTKMARATGIAKDLIKQRNVSTTMRQPELEFKL